MLAALAMVGLPHMAHADVREEAAPAAVDARLTYASQIAQALGALAVNVEALAPRVRTGAAEAPPALRALPRLAESSLLPVDLIKSGVTDKGGQIEALGSDAIAIGLNTHANGLQSVAIGTNTSSGNEEAVAIGNSAISSGVGSTAIGVNAQATNGDRALAIGNFAQSGSIDGIVIGNHSVIGDKVDELGNSIPTANAIAVGSGNVVSGADSVVLGNGNTAYGTKSFVLGSDVNVTGTNSIILGTGSDGSASNVLSIGAKGAERKIVHVAAGTVSATSTDAVNASQLHGVASSTAAALGGGTNVGADGKLSQPSFTVGDVKYADVGSALTAAADAGVKASADAVRYDGASKASVTLGGGTSGTVLSNVAQGKQDLDAVNVSQLKSIGVVDGTGNALVAVTYEDSTKGKVTLGGTSGTVLSNVAQGKLDMDAVNVSQLKSNGLIDDKGNARSAVIYDDATKGKVTLGGGTSGTVLANVAQGKQDTDAVNVSQLKSIGVVDGTGNALSAVTYDDMSKGKVTFGGGTAGTVLSNVAQGKQDMDAVNVSQLKSIGVVDGTGNALAAVIYDDSTRGRISLGGTDGTTISNVKAGTADTDAVNVSQLKGTGLIDSTGNTLAAVTYDDPTKGSVTLGGVSASAPVVLRNVAAGRVEKGSADAVNGDQLFSTMQKVDSIQNGGSLKYFATNSSLAAAAATGQDTLAIGGNAQASGNNAVALGANSVADRTDSVSVGAKNKERQITNVKAGTADTDAVNVSQLKNTGLIDSKGNTAAALTYDKTASGATDYASVTLGNGVEGGTTLHNVASGSLANDAVNVGQLNDALGQVNASLGKVTNASIASTAFFTADGNTSTEGAVASGAHAAAIGANAIATGANALAVGAGANASADNSVALGSGSVANRTNSVSVGAAGGERQVTNVAAGTSGTDAVNLDQLNRATSRANSYTDERFNNTDSQIRDLDRNTRKGIAAASALNVVTPYLPGRTAVNAGVAAYRGQAALGIGVSRWNEKGNFNFNAGVSSSGGNSTIVRAGIGYVFGS